MHNAAQDQSDWIQNALTRLERLEEERTRLEAEMERLRAERDELRETAVESASMRDRIRGEQLEFEAEIAHMHARQQELGSQRVALDLELRALLERQAALAEATEESGVRLRVVEADLGDSDGKLRRVEETCDEMDVAVRDLAGEIAELYRVLEQAAAAADAAPVSGSAPVLAVAAAAPDDAESQWDIEPTVIRHAPSADSPAAAAAVSQPDDESAWNAAMSAARAPVAAVPVLTPGRIPTIVTPVPHVAPPGAQPAPVVPLASAPIAAAPAGIHAPPDGAANAALVPMSPADVAARVAALTGVPGQTSAPRTTRVAAPAPAVPAPRLPALDDDDDPFAASSHADDRSSGAPPSSLTASTTFTGMSSANFDTGFDEDLDRGRSRGWMVWATVGAAAVIAAGVVGLGGFASRPGAEAPVAGAQPAAPTRIITATVLPEPVDVVPTVAVAAPGAPSGEPQAPAAAAADRTTTKVAAEAPAASKAASKRSKKAKKRSKRRRASKPEDKHSIRVQKTKDPLAGA